MKKKLLLFYFSLIFLFVSACKARNTIPISQTGFNFDTVITITIYDSFNEKILEACFELADYYENMFSKTKSGSDVFNINHACGTPTEVSSETIDLISIALKYAYLTNGVVDPTIGGISDLWNFHRQNENIESPISNVPPSDSDLKKAVCHINHENIQLSGNTVTITDPNTTIDLGFIAKGYIADKIKEYLISEGVSSAIINLGGNVLTIGSKPDGSPFNIGIQKPFADTGTAITVVSANDKSVVTSGIYERYFKYNDKLYHHILNPATGYPIDSDLLGVTIISDSSTDGDALSTACLALGYDKATELIESLENVDALFITADGEIHTTY